MKGKERWQKAIIGIVLASIMLVSVLAATVPIGSARDPVNGNIQDGDILFAGEHGLSFDTVALPNIVRLEGRVDTPTKGNIIAIADPSNFYIPMSVVEGIYDIIDATGGDIGNIVITEPSITGNVYLAGTVDSIVDKSISVGTRITIRACPNFGGLLKEAGTGDWGKIKIKLIAPDGIQYMKKIDADASEIDITPDDWSILDTSDWDVGTWKVKIVSDRATCNEVDVSSSKTYEFTVRKEELLIDAKEDEVSKGEDIVLTIRGNPKTYYYLTVTGVHEPAPLEIKDAGDVKALSGNAVISPAAPNLAAWIQTGSDGVAEVKIATTGADERTYTIHVYKVPIPTGIAGFLHPRTVGAAAATFVPDEDVSDVATDDDEVDVEVLPPVAPEYVPGEVLVMFKPDVPPETINSTFESLGLEEIQYFSFIDMYHLRITTGIEVEEIVGLLNLDPNVLDAGPNIIGHLCERKPRHLTTPNDPFYPNQWGLNNWGTNPGVPLGPLGTIDADIDAPQAWEHLTTSNKTVAILDSGADWAHPDLAVSIWINRGEIPGDNIDNDLNGYIDDIRGWDFTTSPPGVPRPNGDNDPQDDNGHGTQVAGIIGAVGNNGVGIAGVCWGGPKFLMILKVANAQGSLKATDVINAIDYAINNGASIISCSFTFPVSPVGLRAAVTRAGAAELLVIAAAGNNGVNVDIPRNAVYPACYPNPNIISVAASNNQDDLAVWRNPRFVIDVTPGRPLRRIPIPPKGSNFGTVSVDLAAPGQLIYSTMPRPFPPNPIPATFLTDPHSLNWDRWQDLDGDGGVRWTDLDGDWKFDVGEFNEPVPLYSPNYDYMSGTSMATPFVSGAAAHLWSLFPGLTYMQIKQYLESWVDPRPGIALGGIGRVQWGKFNDGRLRMVSGDDFGDASDPLLPLPGIPGMYPTKMRNTGACHEDIGEEWLGYCEKSDVSPEFDADVQCQPSCLYDADCGPNLAPGRVPPNPMPPPFAPPPAAIVPDLDRHDDGVRFPFGMNFMPGGVGSLEYSIRTEHAGIIDARGGRYSLLLDPVTGEDRCIYVNIWIDWDRNGWWGNIPGEWVYSSGPIVPGAPIFPGHEWDGNCSGWIPVNFSVPPAPPAVPGPTWLRIRLDYGEDAGLLPPGVRRYDADHPPGIPRIIGTSHLAQCGEVEDYCVSVMETEVIVTIDVPPSAIIGKVVTITVTASVSVSDDVDIVIDDILEFNDEILVDGEAEVEWDTAGKTAGSYTIEVYVDCDELTADMVGTDVEDEIDAANLDADATATIRLRERELTAEVSRTTVALGDDFWVRGVAPGTDNVLVLAIAPKGTGGTEISTGTSKSAPELYKNIYRDAVSVSAIDYTFERKVYVDDDADSGWYLIVVLCTGRDKRFGNGESDREFLISEAKGGVVDTYGLKTSSKTQDQMLDILLDATVDVAGSDDLYWVGKVKCEEGKVILDPIADVAVGEPLVVSGTTNRMDWHQILITVEGPIELAKTACVTNGTFSATFDTTDAVVGFYTIMADDGDGNTDIATVEILTAVPTPTPTLVVTPTPSEP